MRNSPRLPGSLAPPRIGAWAAPGYARGETWSQMPRFGCAAILIVLMTVVAGIVVLVAAAVQAGQADAALFIVALLVVTVLAVAVGRLRRRRDGTRRQS